MPKEKTHYERQQAKIATAQENVNRILTETIITIPQAIKEIQLVTGIRTNRATLHRWIRHGCNGVKLGVVRIGQRHILTSSEEITRFIVARTAKTS